MKGISTGNLRLLGDIWRREYGLRRQSRDAGEVHLIDLETWLGGKNQPGDTKDLSN